MTTHASPEAKAVSAGPSRAFTPARQPMLQRSCTRCGSSGSGGECDDCRKKRTSLQRSARGSGTVGVVPPIVHDVLRSPGHPLDRSTRQNMESRFGYDFSQVRIHNDAQAADSASAVNAHAYTVGQDVVFAQGQFDPASSPGQHLLAHELAHTIQQRGLQRVAADSIGTSPSGEYDLLEREAESAATAAMAGDRPLVTRPAAQPILSRAEQTEGKTVPTKPKKPKKVRSNLGLHTVTPSDAFEATGGKVEEFIVSVLHVPAEKGAAALAEYTRIAGGKLEATVELTGSGRARTALWQTRPSTDDLRKLWLAKVGWPADSKDDLWKRAGGDKEFPMVDNKTCQMDHSIELQLGGDNTPANVQPLNAGPNQASGRDINQELTDLAKAINDDAALSSDDTTQFKLRFETAHAVGKADTPPSKCPPTKPATCLGVESCARQLALEKDEQGRVSIARADYPISVGGGSPRNLKVPVTFAKTADEVVLIENDAINKPISTLIAGLLLTDLSHRTKGRGKSDVVTARIDNRPETRLPVSLDPKTKPITLIVGEAGLLTLDPALKKTGVGFTYKYLSAGQITSITPNESGGVDWNGHIKPSVPFLGQLDVAYKGGELSITKGLDPSQLKPPFPGVRVAEASLGLKLSPEFKPEGKLRLEFGTEAKPLAEATLTASTDGVGFVAEGILRVMIPGVDKAEAKITYKGGGDYGSGSWTGTIVVESSQIKLPYVESGSVIVQLAAGKGVTVDGKVTLALPGENKATVGLRKEERAWVFSGSGQLKVPKVGSVGVHVRYNTATQLIIASAKNVSFEIFGLTAKLNELTAEIEPDKRPVFYGSGAVELRKGKLAGSANLTLNRNGKFTVKGVVTYQFNENLSATAGVELDEKERLKFSGELTLKYFELFRAVGDTKELFNLDISVPIPGANIGGIGLEARIGGGVKAGYQLGPGSIAPLTFEAGFYPLEDDPELNLAVGGRVNIPAWAKLEAYIYGGVALDAFVAEIGGKIVLTGTIKLDGGLFVPFKATYKKGKIEASLTPEITAVLILGLGLDITAWAKAGIGWLSVKTEKTWNLAQREVNTGLGFSLKAPLEYSTDKGARLPSVDQIELKKPDITTANLKRILSELVAGSSESEREV